MKIIGITGGTGTGKTTALEAFCELGGVGIDADAVYHGLIETNTDMTDEIESAFPGVINDNKLDRKKLGEIVFNDKSKLAVLNSITHKYVMEAIEAKIKELESDGIKYVAIDAVELIEGGLSTACEKVIAVTAPVKERIVRIMGREGISMGYAAMRIAAQKPDSYYEKECDMTLMNDFSSAQDFKEYCIDTFRNILGE